MPVDLTDYEVKTPDGQTVTFRGPSSMSDDQVKMRAQQEAAFKSGKIPTTFMGGARQSAGETLADESGKIGTLASLAGGLAGQPEVVAAGPLLGRGVKAVGESIAGRPVSPTSTGEVAGLAAQGAVSAYAPALISKLGGAVAAQAARLPVRTVPQAIAKVVGAASVPVAQKLEQATPQAIGAAFGADVKTLADTATRMRLGVSAEDLKLFMDNVNNGMNPSTAAKIVTGGNVKTMSGLLTLLMRSRMRP